jgi:cytochrome oxidase assembly protein ShyY1
VAFPLQNFVYAFQWWLFGVFALGVYGRWLWLESRSEEDVAA